MEQAAGRNKTNIGACEIDAGVLGRGIEIWRIMKARLGKIGGPLEGAAGEIGLAIEARALERNA
jgi:hypothetical protein